MKVPFSREAFNEIFKKFYFFYPNLGIKKSDQLMKSQLQTMPLDECNQILSNYNVLVNLAALRNGISPSQYCAHDPQGQNDSCQGDSGGM